MQVELGSVKGRTVMSNAIVGVVHGNTIELKEAPGVPEGQEVDVLLRAIEPARTPGGGFLRTAGALADDPYWDEIMAEVHRERKLERRVQTGNP
jgi:hypothetical protein